MEEALAEKLDAAFTAASVPAENVVELRAAEDA
jgi:hypothetical protein